jgi:hypothetical protein
VLNKSAFPALSSPIQQEGKAGDPFSDPKDKMMNTSTEYQIQTSMTAVLCAILISAACLATSFGAVQLAAQTSAARVTAAQLA